MCLRWNSFGRFIRKFTANNSFEIEKNRNYFYMEFCWYFDNINFQNAFWSTCCATQSVAVAISLPITKTLYSVCISISLPFMSELLWYGKKHHFKWNQWIFCDVPFENGPFISDFISFLLIDIEVSDCTTVPFQVYKIINFLARIEVKLVPLMNS